jgi:hypothetical protein
VLHVVRDGMIVRTMPVSSGNGERYRSKSGGTARDLTPVGTYRISRRIVGVRNADRGQLCEPQYFYEGWAIHGSNSVRPTDTPWLGGRRAGWCSAADGDGDPLRDALA